MTRSPAIFPLLLLAACSSSSAGTTATSDAQAPEAQAPQDAAPDVPLPPVDDACVGPCPQTQIRHVVVLVQENHTFDDHFGGYCTAPAGSNPTCNDGPGCCEAAPSTDAAGHAPIVLDDAEMAGRDPDHSSACESEEIHGGAMDAFATAACGSPHNVALADPATIAPYWQLAQNGALADRYFQPIVGASSANDMYFARARFVFDDNTFGPKGAPGMTCEAEGTAAEFTDPTLGDLLDTAGVPWSTFAGGYAVMAGAVAAGTCPKKPDDCAFLLPLYPCVFDPSDVPFEFYPSSRDRPNAMKDVAALYDALDAGGLPAVAFIRAIGYRSEHPGHGTTLSSGVAFMSDVVQRVARSRYRDSTLVLVTFDEGGGYWDHVKPPPTSAVDGKPYGTRVPLVATGPFAKKNFVSHATMEHSSIVKFIEWNWLGTTGQLKGRDAEVANIGSLVDPAAAGVAVPEN